MRRRDFLLLALLTLFVLPVMGTAQKTQNFKPDSPSAKFLELIGSNAKLEIVATGFGFTEGPMWDPSGWQEVLCGR